VVSKTSAITRSDIVTRRQFAAWGCVVSVLTTEPDASDVAEFLLREDLNTVERACSRFRMDAEIMLASRANGRAIVVSQLLVDLITVALNVARITDGAVDPTVGSALVDLGYDRDFAHMSKNRTARIAKAQPVPGWTCVELDKEKRLLRVPAGVLLDLGSTAKAFTADYCATRIAEVTGSAILVNLGGDVAVRGTPPQGWPVGVALKSSVSPQDVDVVVLLQGGGLASSGTTSRTWRQGEREVHHIIDPTTGDCASTCWRLVSVAAPTCVEANAASTAAIVWGESAIDRLRAMGLPSRLVHENGSVVVLNGWPNDPEDLDVPEGEVA
jgi:thiamine biosynthesis lipoprotein